MVVEVVNNNVQTNCCQLRIVAVTVALTLIAAAVVVVAIANANAVAIVDGTDKGQRYEQLNSLLMLYNDHYIHSRKRIKNYNKKPKRNENKKKTEN